MQIMNKSYDDQHEEYVNLKDPCNYISDKKKVNENIPKK